MRRRTASATMTAIAASLAVMSALHLTGLIGGDSGGAGTALAATAFALCRFGVGLSITIPAGRPFDIAYHLAVLPLLVLLLAGLAKTTAA